MQLNKSKTIQLKDGRKLGFIEYGDSEGKPIFFFHGWPGSRYSGKEADEAAKKISVRVISTDRPGIGLSDFKKDRKLLDWPDDVVELADYLMIKRFSLMGVSGGGPYAAVCAYKIPQRIIKTGIIVGLAPVHVKGNLDGMAFQGRIGWANYHKFPFTRYIGTFSSYFLFRFPLLGSKFALPTKQDRLLYQETVKNREGKESGVKEAFRQGIKGAEQELKIYTDDWGFELKDIKAKVYLWYGAKDRCVSLNMGKYYNSQISGSKLFIEPEWSHLSRYNFEEKILRILTN